MAPVYGMAASLVPRSSSTRCSTGYLDLLFEV